ncbi:MAG TPA: universal stress protein [Thermoanaerobaculia bacterium]|nr:universal stress protein [Thermoanaerobaculia bacterium]
MIVCGTDFSDRSDAAADVAAAIAARRGEELLLVHVYDSDRQWSAAIDEARRSRLNEVATRLRRRDLVVEEHVAPGNPAAVLLELAHARHASMVVLAAVGQRFTVRLRVGSVTERVARSLRLPLLIVRAEAAGLLRWARDGEPLGVMIAIDRPEDFPAIAQGIADLARIGPCSTVTAHARVDDSSHAEGVDEEFRQRIEPQLRNSGIDAPLLVRSGDAPVIEQIVELAELEEADLVVLRNHPRSEVSALWRASVSRGVLRLASMSVLMLPAPAGEPLDTKVPRFRSVLIPTDLSPVSQESVRYGFGLVAPGCIVYLLHVVPPGLSEQERHELLRRTQALVPDRAEFREISAYAELAVSDDPAAAICEAADRFNTDVICIGSRGASDVRDGAGSVTRAVMKDTRRPLLVIQPPRPA